MFHVDGKRKHQICLPSNCLIDTSFPWSRSSCCSVLEWQFSMHLIQIWARLSEFSFIKALCLDQLSFSWCELSGTLSTDLHSPQTKLSFSLDLDECEARTWGLECTLIALRSSVFFEIPKADNEWETVLLEDDSLAASDISSLDALRCSLVLLFGWFISELWPHPSCSRAAVNHVGRSLETLICFSASERIFNACCNRSNSSSVTTEQKQYF